MTEVLLISPIQILHQKFELLTVGLEPPYDVHDIWQLLSVVVNHRSLFELMVSIRSYPHLRCFLSGIMDNPVFEGVFVVATSSDVYCFSLEARRMHAFVGVDEGEQSMDDGDVDYFSAVVADLREFEDLIDCEAYAHLFDSRFVRERGFSSVTGSPDGMFMPMSEDAVTRFKAYMQPRLGIDPQTIIDSRGVIDMGPDGAPARTNPNAKVWSTIAPVFGYLLQNPNAAILDIGGGNGVFAKTVHDFFPQARVISVDPCDYRNRSTWHHRVCKYIPFIIMSGDFDIVFLNMSLHHISWPDGYIATALKRLVGPRGTLVIRDHAPTQASDYALLYNVHYAFMLAGFDEAHGNPCADYDKAVRVVSLLRHMGLLVAPEIDVSHSRAFPVRGPLKAAIWRMYARPHGDGVAQFRLHDLAYVANRVAVQLGTYRLASFLAPRDLTYDDFEAAYFPNSVMTVAGEGKDAMLHLNSKPLTILGREVINAVHVTRGRLNRKGRITPYAPHTPEQVMISMIRSMSSFTSAEIVELSVLQFHLGERHTVLPHNEIVRVLHDFLQRDLIMPQDENEPIIRWTWTDKARQSGLAAWDAILPADHRWNPDGSSLEQAFHSAVEHQLIDDIIDNY